MPSTWNPVRAKVQLRLSIQRLRTLAQKKEAINKGTRRDIATDIESGREQRARVKTEGIILEDGIIEVLEVLELFCELILARFGLIEQTRDPLLMQGKGSASRSEDEPLESPVSDPGITEAISTLIYAAPYLSSQLKEISTLRDMLMSKFGRDFSLAAVESRAPAIVNTKVQDRLRYTVPSNSLIDSYVREIARGYGLHWESEEEKKQRHEEEVERKTRQDLESRPLPAKSKDDDSDGPPSGAVAERIRQPEPALTNAPQKNDSGLPDVPISPGGPQGSLGPSESKTEDHLPNTPDKSKDYGSPKINIQARIVRSPSSEKGPPPAAPRPILPDRLDGIPPRPVQSFTPKESDKAAPTPVDTMDALTARLMALRK